MTWQPTLVFLPGESPWTEEPGWLQSIGCRVGRNWSDWAHHHWTCGRDGLNQSLTQNENSLFCLDNLWVPVMPLYPWRNNGERVPHRLFWEEWMIENEEWKERWDSWKTMKVAKKFSHSKLLHKKKKTRYQNKTKHQASGINLPRKKKKRKKDDKIAP